jgi:hypothetical protein
MSDTETSSERRPGNTSAKSMRLKVQEYIVLHCWFGRHDPWGC